LVIGELVIGELVIGELVIGELGKFPPLGVRGLIYMDLKNLTQEEAKALASQLRKPQDEVGLKVAEFMNEGNRYMSFLAYDAMDFQPKDKILELGFGNGMFIRELALLVKEGLYAGIDYSDIMVKTAQDINADLLNQNVALHEASIEAIPYPDAYFDKIFTVNTIYFWENPTECLTEIRRVLKPHGWLGIGLRTKEKVQHLPFASHGFTLYSQVEAENLVLAHNFKIEKTIYEVDKELDALCIVAQKDI
jgi:ubiquinone/menaquinone biosynthesis C-methylase UbiE